MATQQNCPTCDAIVSQLENAWVMRNGNHAQVCHRCALAYKKRIFCEVFHLDTDGWVPCFTCNKPIHCGCMASLDTYILRDESGVKCMECVSAFMEAQDEYFAGVVPNHKASPQADSTPAGRVPEKAVKADRDEEPTLGLGENSLHRAKFEEELFGWIHLNPQRLNQRKNEIRESFNIDLDDTIPVFEKLLAKRDIDPELGIWYLPQALAEAYFRKIGVRERVHFRTKGTRLELQLCFWLKNGQRLYSLCNLRDYLTLNKPRVGDTVTIFRRAQYGQPQLVFSRKKKCVDGV